MPSHLLADDRSANSGHIMDSADSYNFRHVGVRLAKFLLICGVICLGVSGSCFIMQTHRHFAESVDNPANGELSGDAARPNDPEEIVSSAGFSPLLDTREPPIPVLDNGAASEVLVHARRDCGGSSSAGRVPQCEILVFYLAMGWKTTLALGFVALVIFGTNILCKCMKSFRDPESALRDCKITTIEW